MLAYLKIFLKLSINIRGLNAFLFISCVPLCHIFDRFCIMLLYAIFKFYASKHVTKLHSHLIKKTFNYILLF